MSTTTDRSPRAVFAAPTRVESAPVVAFRNWRVRDGELTSLHAGSVWRSARLTAECDQPHHAPDPGCRCGISARLEPDLAFSTVDFRGVSGIVSISGTVLAQDGYLRAEHARIEAFGVYHRWTGAHVDCVLRLAEDLGVEVLDLGELKSAARRYGRVLAPLA